MTSRLNYYLETSFIKARSVLSNRKSLSSVQSLPDPLLGPPNIPKRLYQQLPRSRRTDQSAEPQVRLKTLYIGLEVPLGPRNP